MIEIRKAKLSDAEHIVELQLQMAQETEGLKLNNKMLIYKD